MKNQQQESKNWISHFLSVQNVLIAIIGLATAWNTFWIGAKKDKLEVALMQIDSSQKALDIKSSEINNLLRQREFQNNIKLEMYKEMKDAIGKEPQVQNAAMLIISEMLEDDSVFMWKLKSILVKTPEAKQAAVVEQKLETYAIEQSSIPEDGITVDVFYLDEILKEAQPRAEKIVYLLKSKFPQYRIRLRLLPASVNAQPGYRVDGNQIRYEESESKIAESVFKAISGSRVLQLEQPEKRVIKYNTPNYISVFIRNM